MGGVTPTYHPGQPIEVQLSLNGWRPGYYVAPGIVRVNGEAHRATPDKMRPHADTMTDNDATNLLTTAAALNNGHLCNPLGGPLTSLADAITALAQRTGPLRETIFGGRPAITIPRQHGVLMLYTDTTRRPGACDAEWKNL